MLPRPAQRSAAAAPRRAARPRPPPAARRGRPAPPRAGAGVTLRDVTYRPAGCGRDLLSSVSLSLPPTGLALLVGGSGSGKTTLLSLLAGLCEPSRGDVCLGQAAHTPPPLRRARTGFVFQFPERHFLAATLAGELSFGWPRDGGAPARSARALAALAACGLAALPLASPLASLSGGQQRRAALAVQLARAPWLLLLDEPLAGLDWEGRRELPALLSAVSRNSLVLAATHDLAPLRALAGAGARGVTRRYARSRAPQACGAWRRAGWRGPRAERGRCGLAASFLRASKHCGARAAARRRWRRGAARPLLRGGGRANTPAQWQAWRCFFVVT